MNTENLTENQQRILKVREMLEEGVVIAMIHPDTFEKIKSNLQKIIIHPNLRFMEHELIQSGGIVFSKAPSIDILAPQLFSDLNQEGIITKNVRKYLDGIPKDKVETREERMKRINDFRAGR